MKENLEISTAIVIICIVLIYSVSRIVKEYLNNEKYGYFVKDGEKYSHAEIFGIYDFSSMKNRFTALFFASFCTNLDIIKARFKCYSFVNCEKYLR